MRFLFLILIIYIVYRILDLLLFPVFREAFGKQSKRRGGNVQSSKATEQQEDQDWGGKYVDYEEVKDLDEDKKGKGSTD